MKKAVAIACVLLALLIAFLFPKAPGPLQSSSTQLQPSQDNQAHLRGFLELEAQANKLDQELWKPDLVSQSCHAIFIQLWDQLRSSTNEYAVLASLQFSSLTIPRKFIDENFDHGITRFTFRSDELTFSRSSWTNFLGKFQAQGYRLEQSEWRNPAFALNTNSAISTVEMQLHVINTNNNARYIVKTPLEVQWGLAQPESPKIETIRAPYITILQQKQAPAFAHTFSVEVPPPENFETLDPYLLVYDLDQDGAFEIALGTKNSVLVKTNNALMEFDLCTDEPSPIATCLAGDFNQDGKVDLIVADLETLWLIIGNSRIPFSHPKERAWTPPEPLYNPFVITSGDIDGDGDLDLWLTQYKLPYREGQMPTPYYDSNDGFPSYLLLNDGSGHFSDATLTSGLAKKRFRRTYSASFVDLDRDSDLDLVNISDFCGIDLYENNGRGRFTDITTNVLTETHAFGMAHTVADFDQDNSMDILMIGMNSDIALRLDSLGLGRPEFPEHTRMRSKMSKGNRLYSRRATGNYEETQLSEVTAKAGWAWGVTPIDFDNDSDQDIYIVNGHNSRQSAADYENQYWRHDMYIATSRQSPAHDLYFRSVANKLYGAGYSYGGFHKNKFFLNLRGTNFLECAHLLGVAFEEDCRNLVSADLDSDGRLDLIFITFQQWPRRRHGLHSFRNTLSAGNWISFALQESPRVTIPGTVILLNLPSGKKLVRTYITGDSFRSQHASIIHFGLGKETKVASAEIYFPNEKTPLRISNPEPGQTHIIRP